jgi:hypothetical protein
MYALIYAVKYYIFYKNIFSIRDWFISSFMLFFNAMQYGFYFPVFHPSIIPVLIARGHKAHGRLWTHI